MNGESKNDIDPCYYCGLPGNTIDHVIPTSILNMLDRGSDPITYEEFIKYRKLKVPCCLECNNFLGSTYQKTIKERKIFLKKQLKRRYRKILKMPNWTQAEINELQPTLRSHVLAGLYERDLIRQRIAW